MKTLVLLFLALLAPASQASIVTNLYLLHGAPGEHTNSITIKAGQSLRVVHHSLSTNAWLSWQFSFGQGLPTFVRPYYNRDTTTGQFRDPERIQPFMYGANEPALAGPGTFSIHAYRPADANTLVADLCTLEITDHLAPTTSANTVVIPTDATGPTRIILESSADMITWTAADPGTYAASTEKRFFRVRAERTP